MKPPRLPLSLRVLGGRLGAQWERDRRDTLFLMVPVLLAALPHLRSLPWWVGTGFLILFGWRFGLLLSGRWLPRASVRWAGAIAAVAAHRGQHCPHPEQTAQQRHLRRGVHHQYPHIVGQSGGDRGQSSPVPGMVQRRSVQHPTGGGIQRIVGGVGGQFTPLPRPPVRTR